LQSKIGPVGELVFLKLGGSLITDKTKPYAPRLDSLERLAREVHNVVVGEPELRLVIGHGSGSFGHYAVKESLAPHPYPPPGTGNAQSLGAFWGGFAEVWFRASQLNRYVVEALHGAGLPVVAFPPSAMARAEAGTIKEWDTAPIRDALDAGLLPIIYGDIALDPVKGGTILSTEMLMFHLARFLPPTRILLAGLEAAVWADFPARKQRVAQISAGSFDAVGGGVGGSHGTDVTGGMRSKVLEMLKLVEEHPAVSVQIFSGEEPGNLERALRGDVLGTLIARDEQGKKGG
jgi:isopentenyl phosphate kinase